MKSKMMWVASHLTAAAMAATMLAASLPAGAANAIDRSIAFTRLKESTLTSATLVWTSAQNFGDTDAWTLAFPSGWNASSVLASDITMTGSTTGTFTVGSSCGGSEDYQLTAAALLLTFTGCAGNDDIVNGETVTVAMANDRIMTATSGIHTLSLGGVIGGGINVPIIDDDQVTISASVDPTMAFDLDVSIADSETAAPYSVSFGSIIAGTPEASDNTVYPSVWINLATNASAGAAVTVHSSNLAMKSTSTSDQFPTAGSATQALNAGTEAYGVCVDPTITGTLRGAATFSRSLPYNGTCDGTSSTVVGALQGAGSPQNLVVANGPLSGGRAQIRVGVAITSATPAHPDYTDTLTFLATSTF